MKTVSGAAIQIKDNSLNPESILHSKQRYKMLKAIINSLDRKQLWWDNADCILYECEILQDVHAASCLFAAINGCENETENHPLLHY